MIILRRAGLVVAAFVVWSVVVLAVRDNTESTTEPCLDNVVVEVSGACALPPPSLFPAIPIATAVVVVALSGALAWRRQRPPG